MKVNLKIKERQIPYDITYMNYLQSQTQKTRLWFPKRKAGDKLGAWDSHMYTTIYKVDNQ